MGGGVQKIKICVTSFMNDPLIASKNVDYFLTFLPHFKKCEKGLIFETRLKLEIHVQGRDFLSLYSFVSLYFFSFVLFYFF